MKEAEYKMVVRMYEGEEKWFTSSIPFQAEYDVKNAFNFKGGRFYDDGTRIDREDKKLINQYKERFNANNVKSDNLYHIYRWLQEELYRNSGTMLLYLKEHHERTHIEMLKLFETLTLLYRLDVFVFLESVTLKIHGEEEPITFEMPVIREMFYKAICKSGIFDDVVNNPDNWFEKLGEVMSEYKNPTKSRMYGEILVRVDTYLKDFVTTKAIRYKLIGRMAEIALESTEDRLRPRHGCGDKYNDEGLRIWVKDQIKRAEKSN